MKRTNELNCFTTNCANSLRDRWLLPPAMFDMGAIHSQSRPGQVMTNWAKFSVGNVSSPSRRSDGFTSNSDIRVPWVTGAANSMVVGAKLMALGTSRSLSRQEKKGIGTGIPGIERRVIVPAPRFPKRSYLRESWSQILRERKIRLLTSCFISISGIWSGQTHYPVGGPTFATRQVKFERRSCPGSEPWTRP